MPSLVGLDKFETETLFFFILESVKFEALCFMKNMELFIKPTLNSN